MKTRCDLDQPAEVERGAAAKLERVDPVCGIVR